jgi:hypothetical protein
MFLDTPSACCEVVHSKIQNSLDHLIRPREQFDWSSAIIQEAYAEDFPCLLRVGEVN